MSDKQEFGQLGKIAKDKLGIDIENKDVGEVVQEGIAKFQDLTGVGKDKLTNEKDNLVNGKDNLANEALGKFESAKNDAAKKVEETKLS